MLMAKRKFVDEINLTKESRTTAMSSVVKMVEDYVEEASFSNQDKKEVEVKTRFLQKLKEINKLSRDMEHEMKVSLKGDVLQIRMELEAGAFINEEISDELRREIYEEIFPEVEVKIVVEEEENTADWMKRIFKTTNAEKEQTLVEFIENELDCEKAIGIPMDKLELQHQCAMTADTRKQIEHERREICKKVEMKKAEEDQRYQKELTAEMRRLVEVKLDPNKPWSEKEVNGIISEAERIVDERWDLEESEEIEEEKRQISEARAQSAALDRQIEAAEREEKKVEEKIAISSKQIGDKLNQLVAKLTSIKEKEVQRLLELQAQIRS